MKTIMWQQFFFIHPCPRGWFLFRSGLGASGDDLAGGLANVSADNHYWGANNSHHAGLLRLLAENEHVGVRVAVAQNTHTPLGVLAALASDKQGIVRRAVADNEMVSLRLLAVLAEDADWGVVSIVACHPKTPSRTLMRIVERYRQEQPGQRYTLRDVLWHENLSIRNAKKIFSWFPTYRLVVDEVMLIEVKEAQMSARAATSAPPEENR